MPHPAASRLSCTVRSADNAELTRHMLAGGATIFTINIAHLETLARDPEFRESYGQASFVTLDSNCLNRFFLRSRMAVATGSDFVRDLCRKGSLAARSVLILGNLTQAEAARVLPARRLDVVRPPWGFINDEAAVADLLDRCRRSDPDILFIALGTPQSEKLALRLRRAGFRRASIISCGAAFNFELQLERRAPVAMQKLGLEWIWRVALQPRRLGGRYMRTAFFVLASLHMFAALPATQRLRISNLDIEFHDSGSTGDASELP